MDGLDVSESLILRRMLRRRNTAVTGTRRVDTRSSSLGVRAIRSLAEGSGVASSGGDAPAVHHYPVAGHGDLVDQVDGDAHMIGHDAQATAQLG